MKVLVTGGAGYIGSVAVERLIAAGHSVVVFDNLSQGHRGAVHPQARFVLADLADIAAIDRCFAEQRPDAVMHFASRSLVGESMQQPFLYLGDNVTNGLNLLRATVANGVRRFVLSSTANLFDRPARIPIDESAEIIPGSPYGESKFLLERMLHWLDRTGALRFACLRYFNAAGASEERGEDHNPETHLIPLVLQVAQGRRSHISIFGSDYPTPDGTCVRDYIHVCDLADAHLLALQSIGERSCTYNLGNGLGFSVLEVLRATERITGRTIQVEFGQRRPGDVATLVASSDRIRGDLGWTPRHAGLDAIIGSAWRWHERNPVGYGSKSISIP